MKQKHKFKKGDRLMRWDDKFSKDFHQPAIIASVGLYSYHFTEGLDSSITTVDNHYILWDSLEAIWMRL